MWINYINKCIIPHTYQHVKFHIGRVVCVIEERKVIFSDICDLIVFSSSSSSYSTSETIAIHILSFYFGYLAIHLCYKSCLNFWDILTMWCNYYFIYCVFHILIIHYFQRSVNRVVDYIIWIAWADHTSC